MGCYAPELPALDSANTTGNPAGPKPGYKHLSTHIQELLNDEEFETYLSDPRRGFIEYKGAPIKAISRCWPSKRCRAIRRRFDAIAKYGYGTKVEVTGAGGEPLPPVVRIIDERPAARDSDDTN